MLPADNQRLTDANFRDFANRLPVMIWKQDAAGKVIFTNNAWFETLRMPRDPSAHTPQAWKLAVHPDDYQRLLDRMKSATQTCEGYQFTCRLKPIDGNAQAYRWYHAHAIPEYVGSTFQGWTGYGTDVHDAYDGNAMFRRFCDSNILGIYTIKMSGEILTANDAFLQMIGYDQEDVSAGRLNWRDLTPKEWFGSDEREIINLRENGAIPKYEKEYYHKDGRRIPLLLGVTELCDADDTAIVYALDLSESKTSELRLAKTNAMVAQSERFFKEMANAVPAITWTANADGWIDWYNNQWYAYTGLTPQESVGWGWQSVHHPEYISSIVKAWTESVETGTPFEKEFPLKRHDGEYRWFLTRAHPFRDDSGAIVRWYGSNIDIQSQKESLHRSQRISDILQGVLQPQHMPKSERVRFDSIYISAEQDALVGGDWFEAIELPDGNFLVSVGDVTGHGLEASAVAGRLRQAVVDFAMISNNPIDILQNVNRVLRFQNPDIYATACVGIIDRDCTMFTYVSAGHPPPILAYEKDKEAMLLAYGGLPLGLQDDLGLVMHTCDIRKDAILALYTDGLTEFSRNIDDVEGCLMQEIADLVGDTTVVHPAEVVKNNVLGDVSPPDDIALLLIQFSRVGSNISDDPHVSREKTWQFHSSDALTTNRLRKQMMQFLRDLADHTTSLYFSELIIGEVLSNTVRHAPGLVCVHADWSGTQPVITVLDTGPGLYRFESKLPQDIMSENGRGLFLINALAENVVFEATEEGGTKLQFTLPLSRFTPPNTPPEQK